MLSSARSFVSMAAQDRPKSEEKLQQIFPAAKTLFMQCGKVPEP
jgi:hypothetical protein